MSLDPDLASAIGRLDLPHPVTLIVDVDEVVVAFLRPLMQWLEEQGFRFDLNSYGLSGNIKYSGTERAATKETVATLIQSFFDARIGALPVVPHVVEVVGRLETCANLVLLTNAPHRHRDQRRASLRHQGIRAPLLTNEGPKGPAVAALAARAGIRPEPHAASSPELAGRRVIFIDDAPSNLVSVRDHVPGAEIVHFIADDDLRRLAPDIPGTRLKTSDWRAVEAWLAHSPGRSDA